MKVMKNLDRNGIKKLAIDLAKKFEHKDAVIGLSGPLGAGKTTFTKSFASYFKIHKVKSPTFIVGSIYLLSGGRHLYHYDFYRLNLEKQLIPLGFDEILSSTNRIVLIEWIDKFPKIAKKCDLILDFNISGKNIRNVTIR